MAPHPMSDPGWPRAEPASPSSLPERIGSPLIDGGFESDFAELAAKFAAHGGDSFPADLSAELALEIVLNEIVEQACLATGATGAAVVLERDREMVCRASSGPTAPELGARLDVASGLSGQCLRTGRAQRCDDALADARADAAASQRLGVRSVLVLPLVGRSGVVGLFEVFSPRPRAFSERDERTVEALAERVMKNLERAAEPLDRPVGALPVADVPGADAHGEDVVLQNPAADSPVSDSEDAGAVPVFDEKEPVSVAGTGPARRVDVVGWGLSAVVLACTALLVVLSIERLGLQPFAFKSSPSAKRHAARSVSSAAAGAMTNAAPGPKDGPSKDGPIKAGPIAGGRVAATAGVLASVQPSGGSHAQSAAPAGSLLVFENGKEVFRMPPSQEQSGKSSSARAEWAPSAVAGRVVALSPDSVESSLIHRVEPDYPEEARVRQLQGAVVLNIHIGQDGTVEEARLVSGEPLLGEAAVAAVKQWRFQPRIVDGAPVEMKISVTLNFRLSN